MMIRMLRLKLTDDEIKGLLDFDFKWNKNIPGGFVTNCPKRMVNAYGDGRGIDDTGKLIGDSIPFGYWTAKVNQNNVTLKTQTAPLPDTLCKISARLRHIFKDWKDAKTTPNTFSVGVCNFYTQPDMYIAAHTDDNTWYPSECDLGPVFASITLYPYNKPTEKTCARFEIKNDKGKWEHVPLLHGDVLLMNSSIPHRVRPHPSKTPFCPRINITLRSIYTRETNPIMNAMAISNHSRYYRLPYSIIYPKSVHLDKLMFIWDAFNQCSLRNGGPGIDCIQRNCKTKAEIWAKCNALYPHIKLSTNMTVEILNATFCNST